MLKLTTTNARRALVGTTVLAFLLLPTKSTAGGASTCTQSGTEVRVNLMADGSSGVLQRNAAGAILYDEGGDATPAEPCGLATVFTTDKIEIEDTSNDGGTAIVIDVSQGDFSDGTSDIPITVDLGAGYIDAFGVIGSGDRDYWTFGASQSGLTRGNLQNNGSAEIRFLSQPDFGFGASHAGNDRVCSLGGNSHGIPRKSLIGWVWIGGAGRDSLCGGLSSDRLVGKPGGDNLRGGGGGDVLKGGDDADRLKGGGGSDLLKGSQGPDVLRGGPGQDSCRGGPGADRQSRCER